MKGKFNPLIEIIEKSKCLESNENKIIGKINLANFDFRKILKNILINKSNLNKIYHR